MDIYFTAAISPNVLCRATDKACSILKESSESLSQSTSTIPPRLPGERELGNREEEEAMDTGSTTTAVSGSGTQVGRQLTNR